MEKQKEVMLAALFDQAFDFDRYKKFSIEFFNEIEIKQFFRKTYIYKEYEEHIAAYNEIGSFVDSSGKKILILEVEVKKGKSVERARTMQRNFISKIISESKDIHCEGAFVAFHSPDESNWRLSFVRLDYSFGEAGLALDLTPARRYSYLIGTGEPSYTAKNQLLPILENDRENPTIDDIEKAFSVEKVTKDFFEQYKQKYLELKEYLQQDNDFINETKNLGFDLQEFAEQFAKKLMGQLAFIYFLQKKGWLGVRIVPKEMLKETFLEIHQASNQNERRILEKVYGLSKGSSYYLDVALISSNEFNDYEAEVLTNIFVNKSSNKEWGSGYKRFIFEVLWKHCKENDGNFFDNYLEPFFYEALNKKRANHYFKQFNCKIPFLNGGLFEPLEGYDWKGLNFHIPNNLFSNEHQKGREADGILDIFERFNFTINEDEPLEKEVAVDPEMLGKIFENLLEVKDRKSKGAFYTPREIVHYMCQESLTNYLVNKVAVPYEDMKEFVLYSDLIRDTDSRSGAGFGKKLKIKEIIYKNMSNIDYALKQVKIADPAVGSGAFPLGMLSEVVRLRNNITDYLIKLDNQGQLGRKYGENQLRKNRSLYDLKKFTIQNSIFAVDIDNSAVDITKLRLWLSVVVDQAIDEVTPYPQPLPNLEMNIMVGNSLVDEYEGIKLFDESVLRKKKKSSKKINEKDNKMLLQQFELFVDPSDEMLERMFKLQERYFDAEDVTQKKELKERIKIARDDLIEYKLDLDRDIAVYTKYEEYKKNNRKSYFLWYLEFAKVFKENGGFDIIIGNPPYVGEKGNKNIFNEIYKTEFGKKHYQGRMDLFYFFFHKAIEIGNSNAEINFITTNYYVTAHGGKILRTAIKEETKVRKLINLNELKIFESALGQHNLITMLSKNKASNKGIDIIYTEKKGFADESILQNIFSLLDDDTRYYQVSVDELFDSDENYIRFIPNDTEEDNILTSILEKISEKGVPLKDFCNVNNGLRSGIDKYTDEKTTKRGLFVLESEEVGEIFDTVMVEDIIKPYYKNSDITKYMTNKKTKLSVIYSDRNTDISQYPVTFNYLEKYKDIINNKRWKESVPWYSLVRPRDNNIFNSPKIVCPQRSNSNTFGYNEGEWYAGSDVFYITLKDSKHISLKYILALLNSKLYYVWFFHKGKRKGNILELIGTPIKEVYVKPITLDEQQQFITLIDKLLSLLKEEDKHKKDSNDREIKEIKDELDLLIFNIYGLTNDEQVYVKRFHTTELN